MLVEHAQPRRAAAGAARRRRRGRRHRPPSTGCSQDEFGIDFTHYKPSTVTRRIERRLAAARTDDIDEYVERLRRGRDELDVLYRDLLIGVTRFFRNEEAFAILERRGAARDRSSGLPTNAPFRVVGRRLRDRRGGRIRSPSCSTSSTARLGERPVQDLRDRRAPRLARARRRAASTTRTRSPTSRRSGSSATSSGARSGYQVVPELRQHGGLRAAQRDQGRAVHARRPRELPQHAHLPAAGGAAEGARPLPLRAQPRRRRVPRPEREPRARSIHDFETIDRHWRIYRKYSDARGSPSTRASQPGASRAPARLPLAAGVAARATRSRSCSGPTTRCSTVHAARACSSTTGASSFTRSAARAVPAAARRPPGARRARHGRRRAADGAHRRAAARAEGARRAIVFKGVHARPATTRSTTSRIAARAPEPRGAASACSSRSSRRARARRRGARARPRSISAPCRASSSARSSRAQLHEGEPAGGDRGARDQQRGAPGVERGAARLERGAPEHERGAPERQRGALHRQRRVPAQDRRAHRARRNDMDNLLVEHGRRDHLPRQAAQDPQVHAPDRGELQPACRRTSGARSRRFATTIGSPGAHRRPPARARDRRARRARDARSATAARSSCASCRTAPRAAIDGVVLTLIDVSGLKAAEDALFHERYLLNSLLFSVPDAIYFKDARGRFIRANRAMAARLGLADPARGGRQDRASSCPTRTPRWRSTSRTRRCCAPARRSTTSSRSARHADGERRVGPRDAPAAARRRPAHRRHHRHLPRRHRAEAGRGEDPGGGAPARRVPRHALARAPQPPRRRRHAPRRCSRTSERRTTSARRLLEILERQSQQMARLLDDLLEASRVTQNKIELRKERRSTCGRWRARRPTRCAA